jgi:hypothetical protein
VVDAVDTLPEKSPVRTAILNAASEGIEFECAIFCLFVGLMGTRVAEVFGVHRNSVSKARSIDEKRTFAALLLPKIPRDRMWLKMPLLVEYFKTLKQTKSGTFVYCSSSSSSSCCCLLLFVVVVVVIFYYFLLFFFSVHIRPDHAVVFWNTGPVF